MIGTNRKIRAALVGAGYVSNHHARAIQSLDFVELVGISDCNLGSATRLASALNVPACTNLGELAALGPDVIHILTPPGSHCQLAIDALQMGSHVLVEKPMAPTKDECDRMIQAATAADRLLSVNHSARMDPVVLKALELVRKGACGDVIGIDFLRSSDYPPYAGGAMPEYYCNGGYPFQDLGVHGLCIMEAFLGEIRAVDVRYSGTNRNPHLAFDEWHVQVQCCGGIGRAYFSWNVQPMQNELIIHGTRGVLHVDCYLQICTLRRTIPAPKQIQRVSAAILNSSTTIVSSIANCVRYVGGSLPASPGIYNSVRAFYFALRDNTPPPVSAEEGRRIVAWTERASRTANEEKRTRRRSRFEQAPALVLVTGASGFLGRALIRRLLENGESIRVLIRRPCAAFEDDARIQICYGDLGNPDDVDRAISGVRVVYHAGAAMRGGAEEFFCGTVWGTRNVVDSCLKHGVKRLVHVSSLSVLDHAGPRDDTPVTENYRLEPSPNLRGYYTQTKLDAETIVLDAIRTRKLPAVILRPGQIFGPGADKVSPSGTFTLGRRWVVPGNGAHWLNLVYVEDVVDAMLLVGSKDGIDGQIFNLVDDEVVSQKEYIEVCSGGAASNVEILYVPRLALYTLAIALDMAGRLLRRKNPFSLYRVRSLKPLAPCDCSLARQILGWKPRVGVHEGLHQTFGTVTSKRISHETGAAA